jgi:membrane protein YqaA with SNARE-associated domain
MILAELSIYAGLFATALIAATFLPFLPVSSELALVGLLAADQGSAPWLVTAATLGNVLGSVINFYCGRYLAHCAGRRWFPITPAQLERSSLAFQRYGSWLLLLAWLPVVGDPLTVVAGMLRVPFGLFLVLVTIGKAARYVAIGAGMNIF